MNPRRNIVLLLAAKSEISDPHALRIKRAIESTERDGVERVIRRVTTREQARLSNTVRQKLKELSAVYPEVARVQVDFPTLSDVALTRTYYGGPGDTAFEWAYQTTTSLFRESLSIELSTVSHIVYNEEALRAPGPDELVTHDLLCNLDAGFCYKQYASGIPVLEHVKLPLRSFTLNHIALTDDDDNQRGYGMTRF